MIEEDVQLIHRILSGDDAAFTALVRKYIHTCRSNFTS